ncbi:heat shock protein [Cyclospora cayetanensis]|uniref:Heat shock protein n=1 Tax=Cyclospora cayetanensis TaxID=88456 RepID=A0A1D3D382_9EIME|nr:heat shock protein [Cyclospora cayetanensis]
MRMNPGMEAHGATFAVQPRVVAVALEMRAVLLAALSGRLSLGSWAVNASICRPSKGISGVWRLGGTQAEGLRASTVFEALAHSAVGGKEVTLCRVQLIEGELASFGERNWEKGDICSLHSVRLHAVALGHPVVGDYTYTSTSRSFAEFPVLPLPPQLEGRLMQLHRQLLDQAGTRAEAEKRNAQDQQNEAEEPLEPVMLLPWALKGPWADLHSWGGPSRETPNELQQTHHDVLSALLQLPALGLGEKVAFSDSVSDTEGLELESPSKCLCPQSNSEAGCLCLSSASRSAGTALWRRFQ